MKRAAGRRIGADVMRLSWAKIYDFAAHYRANKGRRRLEGMMREGFRRFLVDTSGATAVEYSVICGCIFLVIIAAMINFGAAASNMFNHLSSAVEGTP
jgi:pilus assembly protein Flp/PilA